MRCFSNTVDVAPRASPLPSMGCLADAARTRELLAKAMFAAVRTQVCNDANLKEKLHLAGGNINLRVRGKL